MKIYLEKWTSFIAAAGLLVLILDAKTALAGATEGVMLCLNSVIPSLFPFFIISAVVNASLIGRPIRVLRPIGRVCGIPSGAESLLLLGLLGGYPLGAQSVNDAYRAGAVSGNSARRMLGFCNNAGPAFIFGIMGSLFTSRTALWTLWIIHILSAILVGTILPNKDLDIVRLNKGKPISLPKAVEKSIYSIAVVCGWVILFRVILSFCQRWFLWALPATGQITLVGILELTNGAHALFSGCGQGFRYVLGALFLGLGGLCVSMQTVSVTKDAGVGMYFPGKLLQGCISFLAALVSQYFLFPQNEIFRIMPIWVILPVCLIGLCIIWIFSKNKCSNLATSHV